ncbi:ATPase, T2SS/T4P/T4SS family [Sporosarcina sp. FSL K6-1508]|uniref:ATPase, T2SS/T4P/T4SS family n=1 Tax=Sporosarcina sp. FSL K6-1508 TaxID=2921553 RepID=UPI0030FA5311
MTPLLNTIIIITMICIVIIAFGWRILQGNRQKGTVPKYNHERYTLPKITEYVSEVLTELSTRDLYRLGYSKERFDREARRQKELFEALKKCNTGDFGSKTFVRGFMFDLLLKTYKFDEKNINLAIPFQTPEKLSDRDVFDIILYQQYKEHQEHGLGRLLDDYNLIKLKPKGYRIEIEDLRKILISRIHQLTFEDKLRIVVQRIYSQYKGFGVIDDIRDMAIDGVSGGVSGGMPKHMENIDDDELLLETFQTAQRGLNSIWVMYAGKTIHFSFLEFKSDAELRRVITLIYKYKFPGQLSESKPYMLNEMHDGSRVTVFREGLTESSAFFIRKKYDLTKLELEELFTHENAILPITLLKYLVKGNRSVAFTGPTGSGKTTAMLAIFKYINAVLNIRIHESKFELNARSLLPERNILTIQETDSVSGQEGLDLTKKMDGDVTIIGEVDTPRVASRMIQNSQVASKMMYFSHHAETFPDLVDDLTNSIDKEGNLQNAERQVVKALQFDAHLEKGYDGERYFGRITECIKKETHVDEVEIPGVNGTKEEKMDGFLMVATQFFSQKLQTRMYIDKNLIEFVDGAYVARERISAKRQLEIEKNLSPEERKEFQLFIEKHWGPAA